METIHKTVDDLIACVPDGAKLAVPSDYSGVAMSATLALIERRHRNIHLVTVPTGGLQAELLIGAGCIGRLETAAITLGEFGPAPRFVASVKCGEMDLRDATCPAIHAGLLAAEKGIPFAALRGIIGSDLLRARRDWKVIENPFSANDRIVVVPAIVPDFALFHAPLADADGNVWVGRRRELMTMAHAARATLVTVEEVRSRSLFKDEAWAAGTIPSLYVNAIAKVKCGAWPLALWGYYESDGDFMERYIGAAKTRQGFDDFLSSWPRQRIGVQ